MTREGIGTYFREVLSYREMVRLRPTLVVLLAVMLCVSCSKDAREEDGIQTIGVNFRVAVPIDESSSAATENNGNLTWGDEYDMEEGLPDENRILWVDFSVAFFSEAEKTYIGKLERIQCVGGQLAGGQYTYECNGVLKSKEDMTVEELVEKLRSAGRIRTLVTANVANLQQEVLDAGISKPNDGLGTVEYSCSGIFDRNFPAIPMWGVVTNDFSELTIGKSVSLGEVALLRSVAKVEVLVSEELQQASNNAIKLNSVSVNRMNTTGYVLPGKWNEIEETEKLEFSETLRIPDDVNEVEGCDFKVGTDGRVVFYLPECRNMAGESEIIMRVSYNVEDEVRTGTIHLCKYESGVPTGDLWNVVRNHLYRYIITNTGEIKFRVEVHPWDEVEIPEIMM